MKKILLIIAIVLCIFQMVVLATAIDIGAGATERASAFTYNYTLIETTNPSNGNGIITSIEIWANVSLVGCKVATFYSVDANFSTRDTVIIGNVSSAGKQTFTEDSESNPISLNVQSGDFIGMFYTAGNVKMDTTGGISLYTSSGDQIPCNEHSFDSPYTDYVISLYGTGTTEEAANAIFFGTNF